MTPVCTQIVMYQWLFGRKVTREGHSVELTWKIGHLLASLEQWKTYWTVSRILSPRCLLVFLLAISIFLLFSKRLENPCEVVLQAIECLFGKPTRVYKPALQKAWIPTEITRKAEQEEAANKEDVENAHYGYDGDQAD